MKQTEIAHRGHARFRSIIVSHLRSAKRHLALAAGCLLGVTVMQLVAPWPLKLIFDYILLQKPLPQSLTFLDPLIQSWPLAVLSGLAASLAVIAALNGALSYAQSFVTSKIGHRLVFTIRQHLFAHVQGLSLSFHSQTRSGELLTKLAGDTQTLKNAFTDIPLAVSGHTLTFIGMFVVMFAVNWELSLIILATMPILVTALFILNRKILATTRDQRERDSHMTSRLNEWLSSISVVQTFGRERVEQDRFNQESTKHLHTGLRTARTTAAVARVVSIIGAISTAATIFLGAWQVLKARMTPGDLLVFVSYMKNIYGPIKDMSKLSSQFSQAMVSAQRIADLLGNEPDIQDRPDSVTLKGARCCMTSPSRLRLASVSRWSVRLEPASRPYSACCSASISHLRGRSSSTAGVLPTMSASHSAIRSAWCRKRHFCFEPVSQTTSPTASNRQLRSSLSRRPGRRMPMSSSWTSPMGTRQSLGNGEAPCQVDNGNGFASHAHSSSSRLFSCWTSRPRH